MSNVYKTKEEMKKETNMIIMTIPLVAKEVNKNNLLCVHFLILSLYPNSMKKVNKVGSAKPWPFERSYPNCVFAESVKCHPFKIKYRIHDFS